jgi:hypothetical protein
LKQVGAIDADTIDPADYPEIMRLCGHAELAGGTVTCRNDDDEARYVSPDSNLLKSGGYQPRSGSKRPNPPTTGSGVRAARTKTDGRKKSDFETVVDSAESLQEGLNLAAKAIHARPPK